ncbi:fructose-1,6-bisphosphatase [Streptococcus cuniculipharyngis]|uniref:Fructose-1,6-bisphosphatase n=1 Tax=Streptococcus cuniculipharyngis TaxID=1562651 RepID=A0A5C5SBK7_9STRE|nr:fructose-1,6-bisphosphatase [Streptococcus cuniculipharyngis]
MLKIGVGPIKEKLDLSFTQLNQGERRDLDLLISYPHFICQNIKATSNPKELTSW